MVKTTNAERMTKLRESRKEEDGFDIKLHHEMERVCIAEIRKKQKKIREGEKRKQDEHKQYEKLRKRRQSELKKNASKNDKRAVANIMEGQLCRRKNNKAKEHQVKKLQLQVKMFSDECRRLKRKLTQHHRINIKMIQAILVTQVPHS